MQTSVYFRQRIKIFYHFFEILNMASFIQASVKGRP